MTRLIYISVAILITFACCSCKKYLEVGEPKTQLSSTLLFQNDGTATGALLAIYAQMESQGLLYNLIVNTGLSADELKLNLAAPVYIDLALNNLTADNPLTETHWNDYYKLIYQANALLEGLDKSKSLSGPVIKQLRGEGLLLRAFFHFYLVNLYGDVPVIRASNYEANAVIAREPATEVFNFILEDLEKAVELLDEDYMSPTNSITDERVRPNKFAAYALLARVYLYRKEWTKAEEMASKVIENVSLYELSTDLNEVFLKNNKEQVWQIQAVLPDFNSFAGAMFVVDGPPSTVYFDPGFVALFQPPDQRLAAWIKQFDAGTDIFYFPYKFKQGYGSADITEYTSVLRLAEQYLIRSEAKVMQDNLPGAEQDLNVIRTRAGLLSLSGLSKTDLLDSIQVERRLELFAETGDRWFNLKRLGKATEVLSVFKGSNWNDTDQLYPIPQNEMLRNPALIQNPGY